MSKTQEMVVTTFAVIGWEKRGCCNICGKERIPVTILKEHTMTFTKTYELAIGLCKSCLERMVEILP